MSARNSATRMTPLRGVLLCVAALAVSACTPMARTGDEPLSPEEIRLRAIEDRTELISRRVSALEGRDDTKLQDDMRNLRGDVERLRFELDGLNRRNRDQMGDLDRRLQKLETQPVGATANPAGVGGAAVDAATAAVPAVPPVVYAPTPSSAAVAPANGSAAEEQAAYLKAFDFLKAGKYDSAMTGFRDMLEKWPQGNFADNAWYWLGESQYVKRQYKSALESYSSLVERFPTSPKVPDALFKSGVAQVELKQTDQAKAVWRRVMKDYPNSNAAGLSRQRLAQLH